MRRKVAVILVVLILIIVGSYLYTHRHNLAVRNPFSRQTQVSTDYSSQPPQTISQRSTQLYKASSKVYLTRSALQDHPDETMYTFRGKFIKKPDFEDDILKGEFVFTGDTSNTPVVLHLSFRTAAFFFGQKTSKGIEVTSTPMTEVQKKLDTNTEYEATFIIPEKNTPSGYVSIASDLTTILESGVIRSNPKVVILIQTIRPI